MKKRENKYDRSYKVEALKLLENSDGIITDVVDFAVAHGLSLKLCPTNYFSSAFWPRINPY